MKLQKFLLVLMLLLMTFCSTALAAMTTDYVQMIKNNLKANSLTTQEIVDQALTACAPLAAIYAATNEFSLESGMTVDGALVSQITTAAFVAATSLTADNVCDSSAPVTLTDVVETAVNSGVSLTVIMAAAPTPEMRALVARAAVALATPIVAADGTMSTPVITLQEVADALLATGTAEADLSAALVLAGATSEQIATVVIDATPNVALSLVDEPQKNECDTSVSPATGGGCP